MVEMSEVLMERKADYNQVGYGLFSEFNCRNNL